MTTLGDLLRKASETLAQAGLDEPRLEARVLAEAFLGAATAEQIAYPGRQIPEEDERAFLSALARRASHEPMAHITGRREFFGLDFLVTKDTLIPRPDTEALVETALAKLHSIDKPDVLDLCCGTGCVGISTAANMALSSLTLADISPAALEVARENAERLIPSANWSAVLTDLFENLSGKTYDAILSNPPYVRRDQEVELSEEVRREPGLALFDSRPDGLGTAERIVVDACRHLKPGGLLAIECDYRQTKALGGIMRHNGFGDVEIITDLAGRERVVAGRRGCTNS